MPSFTLSKDVQWAGLESLAGRFWSWHLMFDTSNFGIGTTLAIHFYWILCLSNDIKPKHLAFELQGHVM